MAKNMVRRIPNNISLLENSKTFCSINLKAILSKFKGGMINAFINILKLKIPHGYYPKESKYRLFGYFLVHQSLLTLIPLKIV